MLIAYYSNYTPTTVPVSVAAHDVTDNAQSASDVMTSLLQ